MLSLQPPFYPLEAKKRGISQGKYGFVFGITNLMAFICSPIFGTYGERIGIRILFHISAFIQGIIGISFGLLDFVKDAKVFLMLSYLFRFVSFVLRTQI